MSAGVAPDPVAFDDIRQYCDLKPTSFEAAYLAARIFGYAAKRDAQYKDCAAAFLTAALKLGLPRDLVEQQRSLLIPLLTSESEMLLQKAPLQPRRQTLSYFQRQPPPSSAAWDLFLKQVSLANPARR